MVSNKNTKKARKPIETTLGKAPVKPKEKETDLSHLRRPIETSVSGIKQVLSVWETATNEVKNLLMYECDIMYECRMCRSIFRSLANFVLHKRNYCKDRFSPVEYVNRNDTFKMDVDCPKKAKMEPRSLGVVIERLHEIDRVRQTAKQFLTTDLASEPGNEPVKSMDDFEGKTSTFNKMVLEKIDSNDSGIFQTLLDDSPSARNKNVKDGEFMKAEVMEIHKKIENDVPVLDPEGKICGFASSKLHQTSIFPKSKFNCTECNHRFATQKSLANHIKCVHNPSRIIYVCPTCKNTFANPWCVYRHLLKVHRMTNKQVRRMREQIHNSSIRRSEESSIQKKKPSGGSDEGVGDSENQWINDIEGDNDFQMCAGCGKHFERKAALQSHSQMCAKRLEVCNSIKENAKKKCEEASEKAKTDKAANDKTVLKGASKRKGQSICSYRRRRADSLQSNLVSDAPLTSTQTRSLSVELTSTPMDVEAVPLPPSSNTDNCESEPVLPRDIDDKFPTTKTGNVESKKDSEAAPELVAEHSTIDLTTKESSTTLGEESAVQHIPSTISSECSSRNSPVVNSDAQQSSSNSSADGAELILLSASTSRSNSVEETIYVSSSDEDLDLSPSSTSNPEAVKREKLDSTQRVFSDGNDVRRNGNTDIDDNSDLFSSDVSFETFCKKVAKVRKANGSNNVVKIVQRKRKLTECLRCPAPPHCENEDDVIFISETRDKIGSAGLENGFAGFSTEETNQRSCSVDFSNLSYNNPLKSRTKDASTVSQISENISVPVLQDDTREASFVSRAASYIDREKLSCIPCGLTFASFHSLLWHMSAHFSWFRFQCSKCTFITFNQHDCITHAQEDHNLIGDVESYILPLPSWKTVLMSHEFRLLKDCDDLKGKHTDEQIGFDESLDQRIESLLYETFEGDATLFGDFTIPEELETEQDTSSKKRLKFGIDTQETTDDFQTLPKPIELEMPANISEVFSTVASDEDKLSPVETLAEPLDHYADESNDDWGLSKVCESGESAKSKIKMIVKDDDEAAKDEVVPLNVRPSRIRTKVKQNDDFVYYDSDINNVLKVSEILKNSPPKQRPDIIVKPKVSNKSVPTIQKRKS